MTSIYIIRHAQALGNVERRFQGRTDLAVTSLGKKQIERLSARFSAILINKVFTSSLSRAQETARGIALRHGLVPIIDEGFTEINGGAFENKLFEDIERLYPDEMKNFSENPALFKGVGGGESTEQVFERVQQSVLRIVKEYGGQNIVIISHGFAIRCFLCWVYGYPIEQMNEIPWLKNTAVSHVLFNGKTPKVITVGDITHLIGLEDE